MNFLQSYIGQEVPGKINRVKYRPPTILDEHQEDYNNLDLIDI